MRRREFLAQTSSALAGVLLANGGTVRASTGDSPSGKTPASRITSVDVFPILIPFRREFRTSGGLIGSPSVPGPHVYVRIAAEDGHRGWGEARPARRWSYETIETVVSTLTNYLAPALLGHDPDDLGGVHRILDGEIAPGPCGTGQPIAKAAVDVALWDLKARRRGLNLAALWAMKPAEGQVLSFTVCSSEPDGIRAEVDEALAAGYRNFNCKIGKSYEEDRRELEALRKCASERAFLWADANRGYDLAGATRILPVLRDLSYGALEQPLQDHHGRELAKLKKISGPVRILVDEALGHVDDLKAFIAQDAIHGITLKLCRMGGISPNLEAARIAREAGLDVLTSGLTESGIGLVAASILAASFGGPFPAALNGPQLLAESILKGGWPVAEGRVVLDPKPGLGVEVDEAALRRLAATV